MDSMEIPSLMMKPATLETKSSLQLATLLPAKTTVETVCSTEMSNVTSVEDLVNPTTEPNPTNAEKDVFSPSAEMELLMRVRNVMKV